MGLHGVSQFLRNKVPHLRYKSHLRTFAHTRVFVDVATYIFKYVVTCGTNGPGWINQFLLLMQSFRRNQVIVVPVFDGPAPAAKQEEQQSRREARNKTRDHIAEVEQAIAKYREGDTSGTSIINAELEVITRKGMVSRDLLSRSSETSPTEVKERITPNELNDVEAWLEQLKKQVSFLDKEDYAYLERLLTACGISWLKSPGEAEAYCSYLVRHGFGQAVVSFDTDCIAHRADIIIFEVDKTTDAITYVNTQELLDEWGLTEQQLVDFGILVGCDYNPGCRKNKIGPVKAVKLLSQYKTIEKIPDLIDYEGLKANECRELFNIPYHTDEELAQFSVPHFVPHIDTALIIAKERNVSTGLVKQLIATNTNKRDVLVVDQD